jgi:hypothetical protein
VKVGYVLDKQNNGKGQNLIVAIMHHPSIPHIQPALTQIAQTLGLIHILA